VQGWSSRRTTMVYQRQTALFRGFGILIRTLMHDLFYLLINYYYVFICTFSDSVIRKICIRYFTCHISRPGHQNARRTTMVYQRQTALFRGFRILIRTPMHYLFYLLINYYYVFICTLSDSVIRKICIRYFTCHISRPGHQNAGEIFDT
jgi:hypothetical protein